MSTMGGYRGSHSRESSETSELTRDESSEVSAEQHETTSSMDYHGGDCESTEWTDEKHNLYLKSMEASFVDQLYNSLGFRGSNVTFSKVESSRQTHHGTGKPSGQYKVLRAGYWQRMNFRRPESQIKKKDESCEISSSLWLKHFRPVSTAEGLTHPHLEGSYAAESQQISADEKGNPNVCSYESATTSVEQIQVSRSHLREQELVGCCEEVSDQNFVDEEIKSGKASSSKKKKRVTKEQAINDQVVPDGKIAPNLKCL